MNGNGYKLSDILGDEYTDFFEYCKTANKVFSEDLTTADYIAYRTKFKKTREFINELRNKIESYITVADECEFESKSEDCDYSENTSTLTFLDYDYNDDNFCTYDDFIQLKNDELNDCTEKNESSDFIEPNQVDKSELIFAEKNEKHLKENSAEENKYKTDCENLFHRWVNDQDISIEKLIPEIYADDYSNVKIENIGFSVRVLNALKRVGLSYLSDVLNKSYNDIIHIKNTGKNSAENIFRVSYSYIFDNKSLCSKQQNYKNINCSPILYREALTAYLKGERYDYSHFTQDRKTECYKYVAFTELILKDISYYALNNKDYTNEIIAMLNDFYTESNIKESIFLELKNKLSDYILSKNAKPFYKTYQEKAKLKELSVLENVFDNISVSEMIGFYYQHRAEYSIDELRSLEKFVNWLDFDLEQILKRVFGFLDGSRNERIGEILNGRFNKRTLEDIAISFGITRERVRQLESKGLRYLHRNISNVYTNYGYNLWGLIYALNDGKKAIKFDDVEKIIGTQNAIWLWYDVQSAESDNYNKKLDILFVELSCSQDIINECLSELPNIIEKNNAEIIIKEKSEQYNIPEEVLLEEFRSRYRESGMFYHCVRLTSGFICTYLLKNRFQQGFKVNDKEERERFDRYTDELFGKEYRFATQHALDSAIAKYGMLCDRGKYIHPDYVNIDESLFDEIMNYIESSPNKAVPYMEIYDALEPVFMGTQITNRYIMQGFIKQHNIPYLLNRDYVQKEKDVRFLSDIENFITENSPIHKSEIIDRFPFLDEFYIAGLNMKNKNIIHIGDGYYIHSSSIIISDAEKDKMQKFLLERCNIDHVNVRTLINDFFDLFSDFMGNNDIEDHRKLFAILRYLYDDIFNFDSPYISLDMDNRITNLSVLREKLNGINEISIEELYDICRDVGMAEGGIHQSIYNLSPEFIRVGKDIVMRAELTGIDDEIIDSVVDYVKAKISVKGYYPSKKINDFIWLPEIKVKWNVFLIESVIALADDKVNVLRPRMGSFRYPQNVYVEETYAEEEYESFVLKLVKTEHENEPFKTKSEIVSWLKEEGFSFSNNLPKYLNDWIYFDENDCMVLEE